jgi:hypothetical protein
MGIGRIHHKDTEGTKRDTKKKEEFSPQMSQMTQII